MPMTPAVNELERLGLSFAVMTYEHDPRSDGYGAEAAAALDVEPDTVFKTLLASTDVGELIVAIVPVTQQLDLKALAAAAGVKRTAMADPTTAERSTGSVVGGISPLGQRTKLRTFVDEWAMALAVMRVSGGKRGMEIELDPADLITALETTTPGVIVAPVATA